MNRDEHGFHLETGKWLREEYSGNIHNITWAKERIQRGHHTKFGKKNEQIQKRDIKGKFLITG
jgi:hypothetical protein